MSLSIVGSTTYYLSCLESSISGIVMWHQYQNWKTLKNFNNFLIWFRNKDFEWSIYQLLNLGRTRFQRRCQNLFLEKNKSVWRKWFWKDLSTWIWDIGMDFEECKPDHSDRDCSFYYMCWNNSCKTSARLELEIIKFLFVLEV